MRGLNSEKAGKGGSADAEETDDEDGKQLRSVGDSMIQLGSSMSMGRLTHGAGSGGGTSHRMKESTCR